MRSSTSAVAHVIYTNVQMPDDVEPRAVSGYLRQHLEPGTSVAFDRFTLGAHTITEIETSRKGQERWCSRSPPAEACIWGNQAAAPPPPPTCSLAD